MLVALAVSPGCPSLPLITIGGCCGAKVGGMGDVVPALGRAVKDEGHEVTVILPKYDILKYDLVKDMREETSFHWGGCNNRVFRGVVDELDVWTPILP